MTPLSQLYAELRDGQGADRSLDQEMNAYTRAVEGVDGYIRAVTALDYDAVWTLDGIPIQWTLPVPERRIEVNGFAVTGWIDEDSPITEWHAEKPRAICMLAIKLRMLLEA
ncbi:hypothetical protein GCM10009087_52080 [Sphingomonas oligophenolica]|uniref:Uncharacterized protein n=1 Tax=Sphingomonas oligophenolica TaxID=301154 RepID=A0ABU9Y6U8_9SPHN